MRISFTKMQGAGNDFVVLDETRGRLGLSAAQFQFLGDRHFGVGADQILSVLPSPGPGIDFEYVIHNADGREVEHCGNGARCFLSFVRQQRLTSKDVVKVQTMNRVLALQWQPDGRVTVDMQAPVFDLARVPFNSAGWQPVAVNGWSIWQFAHVGIEYFASKNIAFHFAMLSMGNPHAVTVIDDVDKAPVSSLGPQIQSHPAFTEGVNVGFMQVVDRTHIRLRVYERGAGETLACGTGACAAVVCGIRLGLLDDQVDVQTRGGQLTVQWAGVGAGVQAPVMLTGPAVTVFHGEIDIPENP